MDKLRAVGSSINLLAKLSPTLAGRVALELFMRPRRIPVSPPVRQYLDAGDRLELSFGAGLVGYQLPATGPEQQRVLLVHGWESHAGRWVPLMEQLRACGCACFALDGPAAGLSGGKTTPFNYYVEAVLAFEEAYGPFDVYVGHSLGGGVVAQLLRLVPPARKPSAAVIMGAFDESEHVFGRYFGMMGYAPAVEDAFTARVERLIDRVRPGQTVGAYSNTKALSNQGGVRGLVVHSRDDRISPYSEGEAIHAAWPRARLAAFDGAGHALARADILAAITDFVVAER